MGELLPCVHYPENLVLVDEREVTCGECDAEVNDDTWMCGVCFPDGALPCGHAIEAQRTAEGMDPWCVDCGNAEMVRQRDRLIRDINMANDKLASAIALVESAYREGADHANGVGTWPTSKTKKRLEELRRGE